MVYGPRLTQRAGFQKRAVVDGAAQDVTERIAAMLTKFLIRRAHADTEERGL
jgi:hypothetical protein